MAYREAIADPAELAKVYARSTALGELVKERLGMPGETFDTFLDGIIWW